MASDTSPPPSSLTSSGITIPSDSENYDANNELSSSSPGSTSSSPIILYKPPTIWGLLRGAAINLLLPFVNGLMLGFGELVANEAAYRLGWSGTKVGIQSPYTHRYRLHSLENLWDFMECLCRCLRQSGNFWSQSANSSIQIFPIHRSGSDSRRVGPGVEMRADPVERRRRNGQELDMYTALE
jgi:hypothetical protein